MAEEGQKKAIEAKLRRMRGPSEAKKAEIQAAQEQLPGWRAHCRRCGEHLEGTLKELREHKCGATG